MNQKKTAVQTLAEMSIRADAMLDRNGVLITEGAIVILCPKMPWAQSWLGKVGKVTCLVTHAECERPVCAIVPGAGCLLQWTPDEVQVIQDPVVDVTYSSYHARKR